MMLKNKNKAFSLTELLIVLVVIAVLFAALAPIITKRRSGASNATDKVWNYVNSDDQKNAFYDSGVRGWSSTAYIGVDPNLLSASDKSPFAKVVIKAGSSVSDEKKKQRQIQFRYGSGSGVNAGTVFLDDKNNLMVAGTNDSFVDGTVSRNNTIGGLGAFSKIKIAYNATVFGSNAMSGDNNAAMGTSSNYIAVGNKALSKIPITYGNRSVIIVGANSGTMSVGANGKLNDTIGIGANVLTSSDYTPNNSIYIGYLTGNTTATESNAKNNVVVGSQYYGHGSSNTIIGYDSFVGGSSVANNMTAIGYTACSSFNTASNTGSRTCIGRGSGAKANSTPAVYNSDKYDHVFLGGSPIGFNGRAVLEVHNQDIDMPGAVYATSPRPRPSVVLNSNLVVMGYNSILINDPDGNIRNINFHKVTNSWADERQRDSCYRPGIGLFGRKGWYFNWWGHERPISSTYAEYDKKCTSGYSNSYDFTKCDINLSDKRLKENITENTSGIRELMSIDPYQYTYKADKEHKPQVGVVAQQLQKVFPSAVAEDKDGYLRIRWDEMFFALINSIKEIDKKVEKLASDITNMETDIKILKTDHKKLQARINSLNVRAAKLEK